MVNQRQLNGGQQGQGSGLDADFTDGKEAADLGPDMTPIHGFMNDSAAFHERVDLEQSLNTWNFDDGFIDIFWNTNKVASSSNVDIATGADAGVSLGKKNGSSVPIAFDEYTSSPGPDAGFEMEANNDLSGLSLQVISSTQDIVVDTLVVEEKSTGSIIASKDVSGKGGGSTLSINASMSQGERYYVYLQNSSDGEGPYSYESFPKTSTDFDVVAAYNGVSSGTLAIFDSATALIDYNSGSLTHQRKDLGFTPSKIVANPEYNLDGETLEMVVRDNSGNSITLLPSDFETEIPVDFQDGNLQAEVLFSRNSGGNPEWKKTKILGVV